MSRLVLVSDWFLPRIGGIELHLRDLAQRLAARGHEVTIVTPTPGDDVVDGVRVVRVSAPRLPGAHVLYTRRGLAAIGDAVAALRPDVVHAHVSIVSPASYAGAAAGVRLGVPTVLTFHSVIAGLAPLFAGLDAMLGISRWPVVFTAVSAPVARPVRTLAGRRDVVILANGIDAEQWRVAPVPHDPARVEILSVGRLTSKKRPATLVRMMAELLRRLPAGLTARLRLAGDGPERPALERLVRQLDIGHAVELLGWRSRDQVRELLGGSDVFVMPSRFESFGLAALEARCAGLPVVAMARSGVSEVIGHDEEGLLARDDRELAAHVLRLTTDRALRERIADHNRRSTPVASWDGTLARLFTLYERAGELVGEGPSVG